ncbi:arginine--tRNA ligase [Desulfolithobacter dissulfuricans]|uniref:Arginine--tRNA ligase n=1 Tax=Desulfolithobacter dissulfuricans TaxID=2795293 RepID=A0A915TZ32_9BACT|nr:arginine--tRNA ligase [Desulfolithobacter dissulfuricans]BCO08429.1 arginine--tRNA ligase [Desulfolithobacter dissulfuricans]
MIKSQLKQLVDDCFDQGVAKGLWTDAAAGKYTVEVPRHEGQGDFSTNMALVVAGREKRNPREVAGQLADMLAAHSHIIDKVEIAGPGFVNLFLCDSIWSSVLTPIHEQGERFGLSSLGEGTRVLVEFVSANPTGPLSIGHGRNGILGDTIARLLEAVGYDVSREYYFNDAGRQMRVLGESLKARYLELLGEEYEFPEDGYQGGYLYDIARSIIDEQGSALKDSEVTVFKEIAQKAIFADIDQTLKRIGIHFDSYFNEHTLYEKGLIDDVVARLREKGLVYEKDGATWFKTSEFGQEQDRVIIKKSGEPTYRLPDIAYHREKFRRGFDWMIDIFGADHIATVPDVLAGVRALGYDDSKIQVVLHQFVTLTREGKQVKMSTRKATFVTVDELVDEVGVDALRFFFLMRKPDSQLEFDLDLATRESQENPVYYVQYAHARLCSIERQAAEKGVIIPSPDEADLGRLQEVEEYNLLKTMAEYPTLVAGAARDLAPHRIIFYLMDLAGQFHSFYNKHKVLGEDPELTGARLALCAGLKTVIGNGLRLVGLSTPEKM